MCTLQNMMINNKHTTSSTRKPLTNMHQNSLTISKTKPKIRIIHIFSPEIIKTDVANFRELVQRLTGKPIEKKKHKRKESYRRSRFSDQAGQIVPPDFLREKIKGEDEIWANSGGGFLGGFGDLDGFMQEFSQHNHEFASVAPDIHTPNLVNSHLEFSFGERSLNLPSKS